MLWQLDEAAGRRRLETPGLDLEVSRTGEFTTPFDHLIERLITPLLQCVPYFADPLALAPACCDFLGYLAVTPCATSASFPAQPNPSGSSRSCQSGSHGASALPLIRST